MRPEIHAFCQIIVDVVVPFKLDRKLKYFIQSETLCRGRAQLNTDIKLFFSQKVPLDAAQRSINTGFTLIELKLFFFVHIITDQKRLVILINNLHRYP